PLADRRGPEEGARDLPHAGGAAEAGGGVPRADQEAAGRGEVPPAADPRGRHRGVEADADRGVGLPVAGADARQDRPVRGAARGSDGDRPRVLRRRGGGAEVPGGGGVEGLRRGGEGAAGGADVGAGAASPRGVPPNGSSGRSGARSLDRDGARETPSGRNHGGGNEPVQFVLCRATSGDPAGSRGRILSGARRDSRGDPEGTAGPAGVSAMDGERGRPMPGRVFGRGVEEGSFQGLAVTTQILCIFDIF